jgi:hypothetical protein
MHAIFTLRLGMAILGVVSVITLVTGNPMLCPAAAADLVTGSGCPCRRKSRTAERIDRRAQGRRRACRPHGVRASDANIGPAKRLYDQRINWITDWGRCEQ